MSYIFWLLMLGVGSVAIYWLIDYMDHYGDDE
jgi:hypothetical protein